MVARPIVLVVEDEPLVRALAVDVFEEEGFEVIEAPSADYALTVLTAREDVNVLFTDVDMPGQLNGLELADAAKAMYPQIVVIVVSGKLPSGFSGVAPEARFMPKPYRMTNVIQMIRHTMAERSGLA
ncbi:hypothetical protein AA309_23865 [Microvirga vignae]|uniref:Response regulatory domain-containing protein n=1 Tax=Microvirga vignae TaxID=1225564 RepID=A0A0H1R6Q4_9HYPH|nr:response regulator [Microvirga vignae]KLK90749.1 hypothetical protein AA309_23865 [Microvirga vignae]